MKAKFLAALPILAVAYAGAATATPLYVNNAGSSGLQVYDTTTGSVSDSFVPASTSNGRGVVRVGNTIYYTEASSGSVYSYDISTHTSTGTLFSVVGASGLATIAYDGTNFYLGDYSGTNNVYKYSPTGTLLQTIKLSNCTGYCDGLEYANGTLISNRTDGGYGTPSTYDVYDLNGNLLTPGFITTSYGATGIAYDGTDFYVSDIFHGQIDVYGAGGGSAPIQVISLAKATNIIEDLSFDYAARADTGGGGNGGTNVPEPASVALLGMALAGMGVFRRNARRWG